MYTIEIREDKRKEKQYVNVNNVGSRDKIHFISSLWFTFFILVEERFKTTPNLQSLLSSIEKELTKNIQNLVDQICKEFSNPSLKNYEIQTLVKYLSQLGYESRVSLSCSCSNFSCIHNIWELCIVLVFVSQSELDFLGKRTVSRNPFIAIKKWNSVTTSIHWLFPFYFWVLDCSCISFLSSILLFLTSLPNNFTYCTHRVAVCLFVDNFLNKGSCDMKETFWCMLQNCLVLSLLKLKTLVKIFEYVSLILHRVHVWFSLPLFLCLYFCFCSLNWKNWIFYLKICERF
jgi:hypothetical protein